MQNAITFFDPDMERQNLCSLAQTQYEETASAIGRYPAAEEIFPQLCDFSRQHGFSLQDAITYQEDSDAFRDAQLSKIEYYTNRSFAMAPHVVSQFLATPALPAPTPRVATLPASQPVPSASPPASSRTAIPPVPFSPLHQTLPRKDEVVIAPTREGHKDPAYDAAQTLLQMETIRILGEAIYVHAETHYAHLSAENLQRLIFKYCRSLIEKAGNCYIVDGVYKVLLCEPKICQHQAEIDPQFVSFQNGVLDLQNRKLYPHSPHFNTFYCINAVYRGPGPHPVFDSFLDTITGGNPFMKQRILEIIGCCLVPSIKSKSFFVLQGCQDSGKSKLGEFIRLLINREASTAVEISTLGNRFTASELVGKQLCLSLDMPSTPLKDATVSTFKKVTGGDILTADVKYRPQITFVSFAKFLLATNHPFTTSTTDPALFRRAVGVPFSYSVPLARQNHNLVQDLLREADAVVFDAISAYWELERNHFKFSGDYQINDIFRADSLPDAPSSIDSMLRDFIQTLCITGEGEAAFVDDLYQAFTACFGSEVISSTQFSSKLLGVCRQLELFEVQRTQKKRRTGEPTPIAHLAGISLRTPVDR